MTDEREPSNMCPDEETPRSHKRKPRPKPIAKVVEAEPVVEPVEVTPLAEEPFSVQVQRLSESAKTAWLHPLHTMAQAYIERGRAVIEGLLGALENEGSSKRKD